jgi:hypothetical protein
MGCTRRLDSRMTIAHRQWGGDGIRASAHSKIAAGFKVSVCLNRYTASHIGMACAEVLRLKREHDQALGTWALLRLPVTVDIPGRQDRGLFRQEALDERNRTANLLYRHRLACPECKKSTSPVWTRKPPSEVLLNLLEAENLKSEGNPGTGGNDTTAKPEPNGV